MPSYVHIRAIKWKPHLMNMARLEIGKVLFKPLKLNTLYTYTCNVIIHVSESLD